MPPVPRRKETLAELVEQLKRDFNAVTEAICEEDRKDLLVLLPTLSGLARNYIDILTQPEPQQVVNRLHEARREQ
jgi:hypothetical protein